MANALYELGKNQLRSGDVKLAFHNFSKFLAMVKKIPDPEGICNAHMALALAYKLCITQLCLPRNKYDKIINIKYDTNREKINTNFEFYSTRVLDILSHCFGSLFLFLSRK